MSHPLNNSNLIMVPSGDKSFAFLCWQAKEVVGTARVKERNPLKVINKYQFPEDDIAYVVRSSLNQLVSVCLKQAAILTVGLWSEEMSQCWSLPGSDQHPSQHLIEELARQAVEENKHEGVINLFHKLVESKIGAQWRCNELKLNPILKNFLVEVLDTAGDPWLVEKAAAQQEEIFWKNHPELKTLWHIS